MKKKISMALIGMSALALCLSGCRSNANALVDENVNAESEVSNIEDSAENSQEVDEKIVKAEEEKQQVDEVKEEPEEELEVPVPLCMIKNSITKQEAGSSSGQIYATGTLETIKLAPKSTVSFAKAGDEYQKLSDSLDSLVNAIKEEFDGGYAAVADMTLDEDVNENYFPFFFDMSMSVPRADTTVLSVLVRGSDFTGGAHPNSSVSTYCFDSKTGDKLKIDDVFTDTTNLAKIIKDEIPTEVDLMVEDDYFEEAVKKNSLNFIVNNSAVVFMFSPYDIAPYAAGVVTSTLSFEKYGDIIEPKYSYTMPSYFANLSAYTSYMDYGVSPSEIDEIYVYAPSNVNDISEITVMCGDASDTQQVGKASDVECTYYEYVDAGRGVIAEVVGTDGVLSLYVWKFDTDSGKVVFVDKISNMGSPMFPEDIDGVAYYELPVHPEGMILEKAGRANEYVLGGDGVPFIPE